MKKSNEKRIGEKIRLLSLFSNKENYNAKNFILDRSCLKIYNECSNKEILNKYNSYFIKIKDEFDLKYKNKGIYVFKRKDKF